MLFQVYVTVCYILALFFNSCSNTLPAILWLDRDCIQYRQERSGERDLCSDNNGLQLDSLDLHYSFAINEY